LLYNGELASIKKLIGFNQFFNFVLPCKNFNKNCRKFDISKNNLIGTKSEKGSSIINFIIYNYFQKTFVNAYGVGVT
jgi:hypothetical protein